MLLINKKIYSDQIDQIEFDQLYYDQTKSR